MLSNWNSYIAHESINLAIPLLRTVWQLLIQLNIHVFYDPAIALLDTNPREVKTCDHKKAWKQMFRTTLFLTGPN